MWKTFARIKHPFCGVSHWIGAGLSLIGTACLLYLAHGNPLRLTAFAIYGSALILLYVASGLYHSIHTSDRSELILRKLDHAGIFLLISGTYVPVCLLALKPPLGTVLLVLQALCATIGILGTFLLRKFPDILNVSLYLVMGWMAVSVLGYISGHWPSYAIWLLVSGGITYTVGAVIFSLDKPHLVPGKFSAHDLWHLFVLGGSVCHFALMASFVARTSVLA